MSMVDGHREAILDRFLAHDRDMDEGDSAGSKNAFELRHAPNVIFYVFEHVVADHNVQSS